MHSYGCPWPTRARDFTRHHVRMRPCQATPQLVPRLRAGQASKNRWPLSREDLLNVSSLRSSRGRTCTALRFAFLVSEAARLRHGQGHSSITPRIPAWACRNPGVTEPTHALGRGQARCAEPAPARMGRARTNHSSHFGTVPPAPLAGLASFPPAPFADALSFADRQCGSHLRWMLSLLPTVANCRDRH